MEVQVQMKMLLWLYIHEGWNPEGDYSGELTLTNILNQQYISTLLMIIFGVKKFIYLNFQKLSPFLLVQQ